jgi:hypothetical protein
MRYSLQIRAKSITELPVVQACSEARAQVLRSYMKIKCGRGVEDSSRMSCPSWVYDTMTYIDFTRDTIIIHPQPWVSFEDVIAFMWPQFHQIRSIALGFDYWNRLDTPLRLRQLPHLEELIFTPRLNACLSGSWQRQRRLPTGGFRIGLKDLDIARFHCREVMLMIFWVSEYVDPEIAPDIPVKKDFLEELPTCNRLFLADLKYVKSNRTRQWDVMMTAGDWKRTRLGGTLACASYDAATMLHPTE